MTYPAPTAYPATFDLAGDTRIANWRPLVHWLLAIPHLFIGYVLSQIGGLVGLISWLVIVFTGKLPASLANFQCMVIRYTIRTYSYVLWLREPYPPFEFSTTPEDPGIDPVRMDFTPSYEGRNRLTVGLRLIWAIPIAVFAAVVYIGAMFVGLASFFAVLFTGNYPTGMRDFIVKAMRLSVRVTAYMYLLTDEYPPFSLD
jgi:hypothetical protein